MTAMALILKNSKMVNEQGELVEADVKIEQEFITDVGTDINVSVSDHVLDLDGKLVAPGFIDLHVHLREPGGEHKETIATGTLAAAKGGFTTVACMPNTNPVPDKVDRMKDLQGRINETAKVKVLPYGAITEGLREEKLTDFKGLKEASAFAFSDDGVGIQEAGKMYEAMKIAATLDMAIVAHCEDNSLINGGCVHEGEFSLKAGLNGIPSICESVQIARDVLLAEATGCHYHVCHISTKESVRTLRDAKRAGIRVTAEVSPHHLLLCDKDILAHDANFKMNPPLRGEEDRNALIEGLLDGTIDFIATDHAPHTAEEKELGIEKAPFGIVGLETAFPLLYTNFVQKGIFTLKQLIDWLTVKPAEAFSLKSGQIAIGRKADITVLDLDKEAVILPDEFVSKGKNTPFGRWICQGWPVVTIVDGKIIWEKGDR